MKETDNQKRKRLIAEAYEIAHKIECDEYEISEILYEIKELNPTKAELKSGIRDLMDCYYLE
jgi:AAA+ ATPase superfamily predicted ATPase